MSGVSIEGAVALVTGGRRGLGRAFVDALVRHGADKVYATARRPTPMIRRGGKHPGNGSMM
jgi:NAD(P)-dependent dehydrogenase (short-subunit alcohol dehydrogenase family)